MKSEYTQGYYLLVSSAAGEEMSKTKDITSRENEKVYFTARFNVSTASGKQIIQRDHVGEDAPVFIVNQSVGCNQCLING